MIGIREGIEGGGSLADLFPLLRHSRISVPPPRSKDTLSSVSWEQERTSVIVVCRCRCSTCVSCSSPFFPLFFSFFSLFFPPFTRDPVWNTYVRGYAVVSFARNMPHTTLSSRIFFPCPPRLGRFKRRGLDGDIGSRYVFIDALIGGGFVSKRGYRVPALTFPFYIISLQN